MIDRHNNSPGNPAGQMNRQITTQCPRCEKAFECNAGNINQCQCMGVKPDNELREFIAKQFTGCCCLECIIALREAFYTANPAPKSSINPE